MEYNPDNIYVTSIDIGVKHLGICLAELTPEYKFEQIIWFDLIDLTSFVHLDEKSREICPLHHKKIICDYLEHVFYLNHHLFEISKHILIERQPPGGITSVEQLIMYKYRDKSILISPVSMHCKFGWNTLCADYEKRKELSCEKALEILENGKRKYLVNDFENLTRQHDVADAICMILFWVKYKSRKIYVREQLEKLDASDITFDLMYLEQFRYVD